jgi:hypothetical protein
MTLTTKQPGGASHRGGLARLCAVAWRDHQRMGHRPDAEGAEAAHNVMMGVGALVHRFKRRFQPELGKIDAKQSTSGVDLTFGTRQPRARQPNVKSQNSTSRLLKKRRQWNGFSLRYLDSSPGLFSLVMQRAVLAAGRDCSQRP